MSYDVDVAVAGAGPTGLLLAGDLARAGVSCAVFERRTGRSERPGPSPFTADA